MKTKKVNRRNLEKCIGSFGQIASSEMQFKKTEACWTLLKLTVCRFATLALAIVHATTVYRLLQDHVHVAISSHFSVSISEYLKNNKPYLEGEKQQQIASFVVSMLLLLYFITCCVHFRQLHTFFSFHFQRRKIKAKMWRKSEKKNPMQKEIRLKNALELLFFFFFVFIFASFFNKFDLFKCVLPFVRS